MVPLKFLLLVVASSVIGTSGVKQIFSLEGDINVAVIIRSCRNITDLVPYQFQTLMSSAVWTTERVNFLQILAPLKLGVGVYEACTDSDYYKTIFDLYQQDEEYLLGVISNTNLEERVLQFCEVLDIRTAATYRYQGYLMKSSVKVLAALGWAENVTVLAPHENILREFYRYSKREVICVKDCLVYGNNCPTALNITYPFVFFGGKDDIQQFLKNQNFFDTTEDVDGLFVPLDGSVPSDLPEKSYVILPPHSPPSSLYKKPDNILPSPLLFEVAKPLLMYVKNVEQFITRSCNDTLYKVNCLRNKFNKNYYTALMTPSIITKILKIEPLRDNFVYDIFRVDNDTWNVTELVKRNNMFQPFTKMFTYNVFNDILTSTDQSIETNISLSELNEKCTNYFTKRNFKIVLDNETEYLLNFRSEAWVYAFLSLSLLGVLFCVSVLIFLLVSIFRRDILEGNPILTLALLLAVMLLFCSVLPFSLEYNKQTEHHLCIARSLAVTLSYATVFSLVLSRCILLATASKEIGFMSHIAGPVQAFLCLFIFGVQAALSLQIVGRCPGVFRGSSFVYLMSYNAMILLLQLCLCPLIYKCQRNYREGKYYTIATVLIICVWCVWLPCYALLNEEWKEPVLCSGLVCTAGVFLGAVFIPRTYLMTIAAARDKITSTLPSLTTATSAMDIYRSNTQPIYDCVNVAAINAVTVARAGVATTGTAMQQPDLYSCPALPEDEDFDFRCETPPSTDKVTRKRCTVGHNMLPLTCYSCFTTALCMFSKVGGAYKKIDIPRINVGIGFLHTLFLSVIPLSTILRWSIGTQKEMKTTLAFHRLLNSCNSREISPIRISDWPFKVAVSRS